MTEPVRINPANSERPASAGGRGGGHPGHGHTHLGHGHGGGGHGHSDDASEQRLAIAAGLTATFMLAEVAGGIVSGSLALLADAGHMLTDFASLTLAWYGFRLARRPADWQRTYGYDRFKILAAFTNGLALIGIGLWIIVEAIGRLQSPSQVLGGLMLWVAVAGLVVNIISFTILHGGARDSLNVRAASAHVVGDLLGSIAAILAAIVIVLTGWTPIDPLLSVLVAAIVLYTGWKVVKASGHILLEGAPDGLDTRDVVRRLGVEVPDVVDVHHVHAWSITENRPMVTLHARIRDGAPTGATIAAIKRVLRDGFGVGHATVEVEHETCADGGDHRSGPHGCC